MRRRWTYGNPALVHVYIQVAIALAIVAGVFLAFTYWVRP
jgi:hypothetical protein